MTFWMDLPLSSSTEEVRIMVAFVPVVGVGTLYASIALSAFHQALCSTCPPLYGLCRLVTIPLESKFIVWGSSCNNHSRSRFFQGCCGALVFK